ncbi:MAG: glycoside hydrolase family 3 C-terminal domain-containing protein [Bryobacteraceae bacterium]|jgi:beta-glucosidase
MIATFSHSLTSLLLLIPAGLALIPGAAAQDDSAIDRRVETMLGKLTLEQRIDLIGGQNEMFIRAEPAIGLPRLKMSDGPMGVRTWGPTTGYAAGIGLAASWDTELAKRVGSGLGQDARARGVSFLLGPGVNIYRAPMNGRNFEYMGEDPYLAGRIASAYIQGVQSQGVIATVKHFAANNSEFDRHNSNSIVDERTLREIYFPAFEAAVKEGHVGAVMDSYNLLNGEHATQNSFLNKQVLKKEWGFRGILMSDWGSTYDGVAAANGGLDLEMPSGKFMNRETLLPAVREGKLSEATIDDKVRRILRTTLQFGLEDRDQTDLGISVYSQRSRAIALESAEKAAVLLKNEGNLLPLDAHKLHTIAVIGPNAWPAVVTAGGSADVTAFNPVSILTALSDALANTKVTVTYNRGLKTLGDVFGEATFSTDAEGKQAGLKQEDFASGDFSATPDKVSTVDGVNGFGPWRWGPPPAIKGIRWTGYYIPKKSGKQRFILAGMGSDGYKLYLNNSLVLEESSPEGQVPHAVDADAQAGQPVAIKLEYNPAIEGITLGFGALAVEDLLDPQAEKLAAKADVVVLCAGNSPETESEGQDRTWQLPTGQDELIKAVLDANPRTIVLVTSGGGVDTRQWLRRTPAFLQTWYAGQEGGRAVARILLGEVNPGGKLPISYERHIEDNPAFKNYYTTPGTRDIHYNEGIFVGYRHYDRSDTKPLFPFGFGLSYTTFAFSNLSVTPAEGNANDPVTVSFDVRNTGARAGAEVAQVYVGDPSATVPRPVKELKGFSRVELKPGETRRVSVALDHRSLAYWDVAGKAWKVDPGKFTVYVGDSSANVPLHADFTVR